jgi:hypothetical protein
MEVINYDYKCIFCHSTNVYAIVNDGGSIQFCNLCNKTYKANILAAQRVMVRPDMIPGYVRKTGVFKK